MILSKITWLILLTSLLLTGCSLKEIRNADICQQVRFDLYDDGLYKLNRDNKVAVKSYVEICDLN